MQPRLCSAADPFYQSSMRREEDFQRTQTAVNVPLISISKDFSTFKKATFPNERICLERTHPYKFLHDSETYPQSRHAFDWSFLDRFQTPIVTVHQFKEHFDIFTMKQLHNLNWNNVFAAGGNSYVFSSNT